ncbi:hypothetical protein [Xanthomonas campestris]|nr:hypothetical protein [Xanthomonas campestris]
MKKAGIAAGFFNSDVSAQQQEQKKPQARALPPPQTSKKSTLPSFSV